MKKYKEAIKIFIISLFIGMIAIGIAKLFEAKHTFMATFGIVLLQLVFIYVYSFSLAIVQKKIDKLIKFYEELIQSISFLEEQIIELKTDSFIEEVEEISQTINKENLTIN